MSRSANISLILICLPFFPRSSWKEISQSDFPDDCQFIIRVQIIKRHRYFSSSDKKERALTMWSFNCNRLSQHERTSLKKACRRGALMPKKNICMYTFSRVLFGRRNTLRKLGTTCIEAPPGAPVHSVGLNLCVCIYTDLRLTLLHNPNTRKLYSLCSLYFFSRRRRRRRSPTSWSPLLLFTRLRRHAIYFRSIRQVLKRRRLPWRRNPFISIPYSCGIP